MLVSSVAAESRREFSLDFSETRYRLVRLLASHTCRPGSPRESARRPSRFWGRWPQNTEMRWLPSSSRRLRSKVGRKVPVKSTNRMRPWSFFFFSAFHSARMLLAMSREEELIPRNTWFFLSRLPRRLRKASRSRSRPALGLNRKTMSRTSNAATPSAATMAAMRWRGFDKSINLQYNVQKYIKNAIFA